MGLSAAVHERNQLASLAVYGYRAVLAVYKAYAESHGPFTVKAVLGNLVLVGASAVDYLEIVVLCPDL